MRIFILFILLLAGCARDRLKHVTASAFRSQSVERCLQYWTANFSEHATNHFYVGATRVENGELIEALVYWKEERSLMDFTELAADAPNGAEIEAWRHELKLGRDTVDTSAEIAGSNYLETHRTWMDWMDECISKGKPYVIVLDQAQKLYPKSRNKKEEDIR